MTSWTERMHRRAATLSNVVTSCGHPSMYHSMRIEKVKFGVPLSEVCKNDIPAPLLILILKMNKEAPSKKDVFRAPGHQGNMKKLIYFLQNGRLINIDNFSVYTIASVLKKFLRKLPDGIFGPFIEQELFTLFQTQDIQYQRNHIHQLILSLPIFTQRLLVLLFGTFRVIALSSKEEQTGMTSEAIGVSVAPSFFQLCVSDGKYACMEDVFRFKVATKIMKFIIDNFGVSNIFGRANYEYYAKITGRILKVEEEWIFAFRYPPDSLSLTLPLAIHEDSQSTPALIHVHESQLERPNKVSTPEAEHCSDFLYEATTQSTFRESCARLSVSLEENGLYKVHERQTERMKTRSRWFLSSWPEATPIAGLDFQSHSQPLYNISQSDYIMEEEGGKDET